jgi:tRNA (guanine-N7-)-methyltransferase
VRQRRPASLEKLLAQYADAIDAHPEDLRGAWARTYLPEAREVHLDLGCGKGGFCVEQARRHPDVLYVGIDNSEVCAMSAARRVMEAGVANVRIVCGEADDLERMFAPGELSRIYLNFNSPFPKRKYAEKRLTHIDRLAAYRRLIGPDGLVFLATDHMPYWRFSLDELHAAGYRILALTEDLHGVESSAVDAVGEGVEVPGDAEASEAPAVSGAPASRVAPPFPSGSEYDRNLASKGAVVYALWAQPGEAPAHVEQTAKLSLVEYLPDDLETLERIPYGMEDTVFNMRNQRRNAAKRAQRQALQRQASRHRG